MAVDFNFMVGGEAGQGIQSVGAILAKVMTRGGYHVFADLDYESRIRGGHNFFRVRVRDTEVKALCPQIDVLLAMDNNTIELHKDELKKGGKIIYDSVALKNEYKGEEFFDVPLEKIALDVGKASLMSNSAAVGVALGLMNYDFNCLPPVLEWHFSKLKKEIQDANIKVARAGYDFAREHVGKNSIWSIKQITDGKKMLMNGAEAVSLGALAAGCKFLAAYPMTPTTPILEYLTAKGGKLNVVTIQPEDEIAAINMVVGASYTGVRAMTATSGSGFALMVEGLGLAGITETPAVIVLGMRPGPAVGLPTRTGQEELLFAISTGTGEFPRAVLAPSTVEEAFYLTAKAFNLADKYQTPVIIIIDTYLANSFTDTERFDLNKIKIEREEIVSIEESNRLAGDYKRHKITDTGISPRAFPLQGRALVVTDSDEHTEDGHLTEDAKTRTDMVLKRLRKYNGLKQEISPPYFHKVPNAKITLVGWGSTYGAIKEAAELLGNKGMPANVLHISEIWPFPAKEVASALKETPRSYVVEANATGQLAYLIRAETGIEVTGNINRFDGRPISPDDVLKGLKGEVS